MRLLFVVQRYGSTIAGGAEHLIRQYALRLVERGHDVEVLTSCATSYENWANTLPAGTHDDHGVVVHRLAVTAPRNNRLFGPLHERVTGHASTTSRFSPTAGSLWARSIGPVLDGLTPWLRANAHRFDAVVFSGYMYSPTTQGLPAISGLVPTILQSVAHDEVPLQIPAMRAHFDHAAGFNFLTEEEGALVEQRFRPTGVKRVFGAGVDLPPERLDDSVRSRFGIGDGPYIVCVGRIDPAKGMHELARYFREYRRRSGDEIGLVFVGSEVHPIERSEGIVVTGFVDDDTKWSLIAEAELLAQPSYFESFSLSLTEGWRCGKAALVQGRNDVLAGQVTRANGGLMYTNFAEFDAALGLLRSDPDRSASFGENGRAYVERYNWPQILDSFEELVRLTSDEWQRRRSPARTFP